MQPMTRLMLAFCFCAGLCAVLLCNPTLGLYLQDGPPTSHWLNRYLGASRGQWKRAWTSTKADQGWNILYHVGGNGPWIQKIDGVVEEGFEPPPGCEVDQVHMVSEWQYQRNRRKHNGESSYTNICPQMSRHAERYPTTGAGGSGSILPLIAL